MARAVQWRRQLISCYQISASFASSAHDRFWHTAAINQGALCPQLAKADLRPGPAKRGRYVRGPHFQWDDKRGRHERSEGAVHITNNLT